jgi:transcriptional regulator with XRE-family HTH domain
MDQPFHLQLKALRENKELTLADVSHKTRIPVARLSLLEAGDYASFGGMAYARYFLKAYANFLGVASEPQLQSLPQPVLGGAADYRYLTRSLGPWVLGLKGTNSPAQRRALEDQTNRSLTIKVAGLVGLISVACVAWVMYLGASSPAASKTKATQEQPAATLKLPAADQLTAKNLAAAEQVRRAVTAQ